MDLKSDDNMTIGDFNCPLDPGKNEKRGILIPSQHLMKTIDSIQSEFSLHDIWHIKNPTTQFYME